MLKPQVLIFLILVSSFYACKPPSSPNEVTTAITEEETATIIEETAPLLEINLEDVYQEGALATSIDIALSYDPVFQRAKKYEAIPLKPYLEKLITSQNLDTANTEIIFLCKDGYNPGMTISKVMNHEPYLAIRDIEAKEGKNWMDTLKGKWAPFYLIWTNHTATTKGFTWPYGLKYLQFKAADEAYKAAVPKEPKMMAGFELYKAKCMKCHSINKVGGLMGPEFNIPKNITEYWQKSDIKAYVKNPYAYRYNSKMPPVAGIMDTEIDQIIEYLAYMSQQKIATE